MKKLSIEINNTKLYKCGSSVRISGAGLESLISDNLPEDMEDYKDYVVDAKITIEFIPDLEAAVTVTTDGYEVKKEETSESEVEADGEGN